ncbi:hypothetical protein SYK_23920 [Pseudodesulfovibrio nedwellii]|uniref:Uncharacterized protein n=1 Tax=Pseudodesulfovibrio nedwellii TaxID=2973072 RepID=A0ABN6S6V8_9BACT|nr:hypothetical protein [Pseudodesulfovibrio nedwellii]BDQ38032.1 hypothetical protein SYK_23920 [Pseudodesulfovibrio nedwellii]
MSRIDNVDETFEAFERKLTSIVKDCIYEVRGTNLDGSPAPLDAQHYRKIKKIYEKVQKQEIARYQTEKPPRGSWPFNDKQIRVKEGFERFYHNLRRHVIRWNDHDGNFSISDAGGNPYRSEKYDDGTYGDVVVRADFKAIEINTGFKRSAASKYFKKLTDAGVLIKLNTKGRQQALYVIGNWRYGMNNTYSCYPRLNRMALREDIRVGLLKQGLALCV